MTTVLWIYISLDRKMVIESGPTLYWNDDITSSL